MLFPNDPISVRNRKDRALKESLMESRMQTFKLDATDDMIKLLAAKVDGATSGVESRVEVDTSRKMIKIPHELARNNDAVFDIITHIMGDDLGDGAEVTTRGRKLTIAESKELKEASEFQDLLADSLEDDIPAKAAIRPQAVKKNKIQRLLRKAKVDSNEDWLETFGSKNPTAMFTRLYMDVEIFGGDFRDSMKLIKRAVRNQ